MGTTRLDNGLGKAERTGSKDHEEDGVKVNLESMDSCIRSRPLAGWDCSKPRRCPSEAAQAVQAVEGGSLGRCLAVQAVEGGSFGRCLVVMAVAKIRSRRTSDH